MIIIYIYVCVCACVYIYIYMCVCAARLPLRAHAVADAEQLAGGGAQRRHAVAYRQHTAHQRRWGAERGVARDVDYEMYIYIMSPCAVAVMEHVLLQDLDLMEMAWAAAV